MKIIQLITRTQRRGAEIFASQLAQKLLEKGHEVLVISVYGGKAKLPFDGKLETLDANPSWRGFDFKAWKKLDTLIRDFQPDILQANASETLKFAAISKKMYGWKAVLVYRNANTISGFLDTKAKLIFNRCLMKEVDAVVSVSDATLQDFSSIFDIKHQVAVPIGIDAEEISRSLLAVDSSPLTGDYLIFIGGLVPEKDPLGMMEIFGSLSKNFPHLQLVYLGSGHLWETLSSQIQQRGWVEKVKIIPNQKNIFPLLHQAKALVMPSKIEGLPAVILEAMYCRVPVVAYGVGGIPEVLESGKTGWCIDPEDREAFVQAIQEVLEMEEGRKKKILDSAFDLVTADYNLATVAKKFEQFYLQILE